MDFVRLNAGTYIPDLLVEGYNSLVFTERFNEPGDFELRTFNVETVAALLPEGTFVSHLETQEMMVVENLNIEEVGEGEDAKDELVITGRSAWTVLEHRYVEAEYRKKRPLRRAYSATSAAGVLIFNAIDNASGKDVTRGDDDPETEAQRNDYSWTTADVIPNVAITESVISEGPSRKWYVEEGMLWPQLQKILIDADLALRCMRPVTGNTGVVITVNTALATRGVVVRTPTSNITALRFDIYDGIDRSATVKFSRLQGHLSKPKYLSSNKDFKTVVELKSDVSLSDVYRSSAEAALTGWKRRTMEMDAGTPELPPEPEKPEELRKNATKEQKEERQDAMDVWLDKHAKWKNKVARIKEDFREDAEAAALRALKVQRRLSMFSSDISALAPYRFKEHYNLGDVVSIFGDYGLASSMIVAEYVRTEDSNGDRGFPGLVAP